MKLSSKPCQDLIAIDQVLENVKEASSFLKKVLPKSIVIIFH